MADEYVDTSKPFNRAINYLEDLSQAYAASLSARVQMLQANKPTQQAQAYEHYRNLIEAVLDLMSCSGRFDHENIKKMYEQLEDTPPQIHGQRFNPYRNKNVKKLKRTQRMIAAEFAENKAMDTAAEKMKTDSVMSQTLR